MTVQDQAARGLRGRVDGVPVPPEPWTRRHAASLVKLLALRPAGGCTASRSSTRCGRAWRRGGGAPAAQGGPLRPPRARGRRDARASCATTWWRCCRTPTSRSTSTSSARRARQALADGPRRRPRTRLGLYAGALLPEDLYEPWARGGRGSGPACCTSTCCGWPGAGRSCCAEDPTDEAGPPGPGRRARRPGRRTGRAAPVRAAGPGAARELGTAPSPEAAASCEPGWRRRRPERRPPDRARGPAGRPPRASATEIREPSRPGRRRARRHACCSPGRRGRQDRACSTWPRRWRANAAGAPAAAPRRRSRGRGPTHRCSRRSATSAASTRPCSTGSTTSTGARSTGRCPARDVSWSGESGHQRLFVAAAELVRLAATGHGLLLVVDDLHEADEASLRLLHYLSRCARDRAGADRAGPPAAGRARPRSEVADSLVAPRRAAPDRAAHPLDRRRRPGGCSRDRLPDLADGEPSSRSAQVSGGLPFAALELARQRRAPAVGAGAARRCPTPVRATPSSGWRCSGTTFTTDELLAVAGVGRGRGVPAPGGRRSSALRRRAGRDRATGSATRWCGTRSSTACLGARRRRARREVAERLAALGAPPARVAHQFLAAGLPRGRCPTCSGPSRPPGRWAPTATRCPDRRGARPRRAATTCRGCWRGGATCCMALGDPGAVAAYREAARGDHRDRAPAGPRPAGPRGRASPATSTPPARRSPGSSSRATPPTGRSCWPGATSPTSPATSTPPGTSPARPATCSSSPRTRGSSSTWSRCRG